MRIYLPLDLLLPDTRRPAQSAFLHAGCGEPGRTGSPGSPRSSRDSIAQGTKKVLSGIWHAGSMSPRLGLSWGTQVRVC